jgi:hypothetical protein
MPLFFFSLFPLLVYESLSLDFPSKETGAIKKKIDKAAC